MVEYYEDFLSGTVSDTDNAILYYWHNSNKAEK